MFHSLQDFLIQGTRKSTCCVLPHSRGAASIWVTLALCFCVAPCWATFSWVTWLFRRHAPLADSPHDYPTVLTQRRYLSQYLGAHQGSLLWRAPAALPITFCCYLAYSQEMPDHMLSHWWGFCALPRKGGACSVADFPSSCFPDRMCLFWYSYAYRSVGESIALTWAFERELRI